MIVAAALSVCVLLSVVISALNGFAGPGTSGSHPTWKLGFRYRRFAVFAAVLGIGRLLGLVLDLAMRLPSAVAGFGARTGSLSTNVFANDMRRDRLLRLFSPSGACFRNGLSSCDVSWRRSRRCVVLL